MPIVIDASVAVDWFLPARPKIADLALDAVVADGAIVPVLWRWEIQDVLRRFSLAGRLTQTVDVIRAELRELPIVIDDGIGGPFGPEAAVAARYNLTVYDAAYLELAIRRGVTLASGDGALIAAAKAAKLKPLGRRT